MSRPPAASCWPVKRPSSPGRPDRASPTRGSPLSCGLAWRRAVAVQGAGAVGAGGGGAAVVVEPQVPAPPMDGDLVVEGAQRHQVVQRGGPAAGPGDQVVDVADGGGLVAAGEGAVGVAGGGGAAQVGGDGFGGGADVQGQADRGRRGAVEGAAEAGGEAAGSGQGVGGQAQQRPPQPVPGGRADRRARTARTRVRTSLSRAIGTRVQAGPSRGAGPRPRAEGTSTIQRAR